MADIYVEDLEQETSSSLDGSEQFVMFDSTAGKRATLTEVTEYMSNAILSENIAAEYSASSTYAVGDYCIYDGQLYRCTTAITTVEAWTAAHWTMATVGEELTDLKEDLEELGTALIIDTNYKIKLTGYYKQGVVHNGAYSNPNTGELITAYSPLYAKKYGTFELHLDVANGYKALMVFYASANDSSPLTGPWLQGNNVVQDTVNTATKGYFCIEVRKTDNSNITPEEAKTAVDAYYSKELLSDRPKIINMIADSTDPLLITSSCDINGNGHTINVGQNAEFGVHILGDDGVVVNIYNLTIKGGYESAVRVNHGATVNFYNCNFEEASQNGLSVLNSNTNCFNCVAKNNGYDGFNYHLSGNNAVYECVAINNGDDGISNHDQSTLKINGGRYSGNGKAGIACPTYGADQTDIRNVYCSGNTQYGILVHNDTALTEKVIIQNAILENSPVGLAVNGYQVITQDVAFVNCTTQTTVGNGGTITNVN